MAGRCLVPLPTPEPAWTDLAADGEEAVPAHGSRKVTITTGQGAPMSTSLRPLPLKDLAVNAERSRYSA